MGGWHNVSPGVNSWCLSLLAPGNDRGAFIYRGNSVSNIGLHWGGIYGAWSISDRLTCTNQLLPTSSWALPQHLAPSTHRSLINLFLTSISSTQSCPFHAAVQITFHPPPPPSSIPSDHGELAITCEGNQSVIESRVRCHVIGDRIIGTGSLCCPEPDAPQYRWQEMRSLIAQGQLGPPTPSPPSNIADPDTLQSARVEYVPLSRHDFIRFPRSWYTPLRSSLHNSLCNYLRRPIADGYAIYIIKHWMWYWK